MSTPDGKMKLLDMEEGEIRRALRDGRIKVSVYGLGHVGSPILAAWLQAGASGIGVDVDEGKVLKLSRGESPVDEPCLTDVFRKALNEGRLKATSDGEWASRETHVKIIAVPTLIDGEGNPKLDAIRAAAKSIASGLKEGNLVILESSVPPGTTRGVLKPILEELSGLQAGEDFGLAYSPERISEGRALRDIVESYPKVVGGIDAKSTEVAANLYSLVVKKGVIKLSSDLAAELEKLAE
ncbi:MAG: nucleotide sugar dehydrogenase, partial [Candidatus Korarchaeota archaeon]|nr:nucleotide sugar dehydrogenase [Candidatus Korarchaeota archaeon]